MRTKPAWWYRQSGVVPVRVSPEGPEVLVVTSRRKKRWIVPKGIVEPDLSPAASAAKEAWEEAGVRGRVLGAALGAYEYEKWGGTCTVEVFLMRVDEVAGVWPEADRSRQWLTVEGAAGVLREPELAALVRRVPDALAAWGRAERGETG